MYNRIISVKREGGHTESMAAFCHIYDRKEILREKKQMIPTEDGIKLTTVLPNVVKSPKLTADWENELTLVSKGEVSAG